MERFLAQYALACWVVTDVAEQVVGVDAMREIAQAALAGEIPYLGDGSRRRSVQRATSWQEWADLVDERGLIPAGETDFAWLTDLLLEVGAATGGQVLDDRAATRAAYHDLLAATDPWAAPTVLRFDMAGWSFEEAADEIEVALEADAARDAAVEAVPELPTRTRSRRPTRTPGTPSSWTTPRPSPRRNQPRRITWPTPWLRPRPTGTPSRR